uniref:Uncharacterized protein n=1 Tax=Parascaris equorum TaxID=6256 RepID=A0A914RKI7_PAREQ
MRKKRRRNDGIGVRHVSVRSNSEIRQEQLIKANESGKDDRTDSNTASPTEEIAGSTKKTEKGTTKKLKRKINKRNGWLAYRHFQLSSLFFIASLYSVFICYLLFWFIKIYGISMILVNAGGFASKNSGSRNFSDCFRQCL